MFGGMGQTKSADQHQRHTMRGRVRRKKVINASSPPPAAALAPVCHAARRKRVLQRRTERGPEGSGPTHVPAFCDILPPDA